MFETIIAQDKTIDLLKNDIIKKSLNNSMLFYGPKFTGKLTTALEMVRILNCKKEATLNCDCINCNRIRTLDFEGLIFLSRRNFTFYIREFIFSYKITKNLIFIDKIKYYTKLLFMPLQDFLIKDSSFDTDRKDIISKSEEAYDIINSLKIEIEDLEKLEKIALDIFNIYKKPNIPVSSMREMLDWTYIAHPDINRFVIIDMVDFLDDSSKNILLKRLEEPSKNLFFILIAENRNKVLQTILSRCRNYYFQPLSRKSVAEIIEKVFGLEKEKYEIEKSYDSIEDYIYRSDETYSKNIYPSAVKILNYTLLKEHTFMDLLTLLQNFNDRKIVKAILNEINIIFSNEIINREKVFVRINNDDIDTNYELNSLKILPYETLNLLKSKIVEYINKIDKFNLNPVLTLEGIFYPLKSMILENDI
ncbi:MAG TPA: hypothetical protein PLE45_03625 [Spirochaetota bacterium]|nr:hypothetical protein [Spirochaetota bacterium]HOL56330.1 hypothetical protein [Spirochaetota bacterium]HPP03553.1 hypothetical protein [Spirochaetota bacterium]